jgi:hypothetical protein
MVMVMAMIMVMATAMTVAMGYYPVLILQQLPLLAVKRLRERLMRR